VKDSSKKKVVNPAPTVMSDQDAETLAQVAQMVNRKAEERARGHLQELARELLLLAGKNRLTIGVLLEIGKAAAGAVTVAADGMCETGEVFDLAKLATVAIPQELFAAERREVVRMIGELGNKDKGRI